MLDENQKFNLTEKRDVPLILFAFIVRKGHNNIVPIPQDINLIAAYTPDEAIKSLGSNFPSGTAITYDLKSATPVATVLKMFDKYINSEPKPEPELVTRTKRDFYKEIIEGMIKDASAFANNETEKNILLVALHKMLSLVE
jgi:hypothetical protein